MDTGGVKVATLSKREALEAAITAHAKPDAPGKWSVDIDDEYIFLIWTCDEDALPEMYGDEPWSEWGGNEIVAASGLGNYKDSGIEVYTDKYDEPVVSHFVEWEL
jgi:hypothetical protein